ncbi:MAG: hypothetical protein OXT65_06250 [Alphaproteobacteria bacterium]|nr:hypothetical protein [Alphaproteobacteria bacterium]
MSRGQTAGVRCIDSSRLDATAAMHGQMAARVVSAKERVMARTRSVAAVKPSFRPHMAILGDKIAAMHVPSAAPTLTAQEEAALESALACETEKIFAIIAFMISEMEGEMGHMQDLLDLINALDADFFRMLRDGSDNPDMPMEPEEIFKKALFYYKQKLI